MEACVTGPFVAARGMEVLWVPGAWRHGPQGLLSGA